MKNILYSIVIILIGSSVVQAQDELIIEPSARGILNDIIAGDTSETGARNPNRVYVLRRNAVYKTTGEIINNNFKLRIRAEDGPGSRPIIQPTVGRGGESFRPFTVQDDIELRGLYVTSVDDQASFIERIMRVTADSVRVDLDDCWFDGDAQSVVRFDNRAGKVYMTNCIVSHSGRTFVPNNGRVIDFRTNGDTLVMHNNTLFNVTSRMMRVTGGRYVLSVSMRNNTIMNFGQIVADFGEAIEVEFVDNLLVNAGFIGTSRGGSVIGLDALSDGNAGLLSDAGVSTTQTATVSNNWFYYTPDVIAAWTTDTLTLTPLPFYDSDLTAATGIDSLVLVNDMTGTGPVTFKDPAVLPENTLKGMIEDQLLSLTGERNLDNGTAPNWNFLETPFFGVISETLTFPWEFPYNFSYLPTDGAATYSSTGGPVGDSRWPLEAFNIVTGNEDLIKSALTVFPNPTRDLVRVRFKDNRLIKGYRLLDVMGRTIEDVTLQANQVSTSLVEQPAGFYMLYVSDLNNELHLTRVVKR